MMKKILSSLLVITLLSSSLIAQQDNVFPENRADFLKQFKEFFNKSKSKDLESFFKDFEAYFHSGISEEEFPVFREVCNEMLAKKMSPNPYFKN